MDTVAQLAAAYGERRLPGPLHSRARTEYQEAARALARLTEAPDGSPWPPAGVPLGSLSDALVSRAMARLVDQGRSPATANKLRQHVLALWRAAIEEFGAPLPPPRVRRLRELRREPSAWTEDEVRALAAAAAARSGQVGRAPAGEFWSAFVLVGYCTGIRIGSLMRLKTADYRRDSGEVFAPAEQQKQRADQWLDLWPSAVDAIERLAPWSRGHDRLFGDWPYDNLDVRDAAPSALRRSFRRLLVEARLYPSVSAIPKGLGFHQLRRTIATHIAKRHGDDAARVRLGQSSLAVTKRYVDRRQLATPAIVELAPDPLGPIPTPPRSSSLRVFRGPFARRDREGA